MQHEIFLSRYTAQTEDLASYLKLGTAESHGNERLLLHPGEDWQGLVVTATFHPPGGGESVRMLAMENLVEVPPEATAVAGMGQIVFAGLAEGARRISCDLIYRVQPHEGTERDQDAGVTPPILEQAVLAAAKSESAAAESARGAAQSAADAEDAAARAEKSAEEAAQSAEEAAKSAADAAESEEEAAKSADAAAESARKAAASEPAGAADRAEQAARQAQDLAAQALDSAQQAQDSASQAQTARTGAENAAASAAESAQAAQEYLSIAARTVVREITVPAEGWFQDETAPLALDVAVEGAEESQIPLLALHPEALAGARDAGLYPVAQTREGAVRLWAKRAPAAELPATLILLSGGGAGGLPIATANTLGGVMIGENVNVTSDGKISVKEIPVPAAEGVMREIVDQVFSEE